MLSRLFARWRQPKPEAPAPAPAPAAPRPATSRAPAAGTPATGSPTSVSAWHLVTRRPLIDSRGGIAGWDLRLSDWATQRLARTNAQRVMQETYTFALLQAMRDATQGGRRPLLSLIGLGETEALLPSLVPGTILIVGDGSGNPVERVASHLDELHAAGIRLAAPPEVLAALPADYALLDGARMGSAEVLRRCRHPAPAPGGWIATNLASFEEVADAVTHKVQLACGRFADARERPRKTMAPPLALNIATILTALVNGKAPRDLAEMFKGDVTLSYRLLRYLSMAGVGHGRAPQSIQDAVMLLGARELHRWLCVLLADAGVSPISRALHETALTRGRLLELLALARRERNPEQLFVLGAFSLLDLLLDVPLEVALALTPLPEPAVDALIAETGPWRPYLEAALAIEAGDPARLDAACLQLGLTRDEVVAFNEKAAGWSTQAASFAQQAG